MQHGKMNKMMITQRLQVWDFHSGVDEESILVGSDATLPGKLFPVF